MIEKKKSEEKFKWKQVYGESYPITLQFNTADNEWIDWLEVKRSRYEDAGNGLFACVDIPVNARITVYMGNEKDKEDPDMNYMFKTNWQLQKKYAWRIRKEEYEKVYKNN